ELVLTDRAQRALGGLMRTSYVGGGLLVLLGVVCVAGGVLSLLGSGAGSWLLLIPVGALGVLTGLVTAAFGDHLFYLRTTRGHDERHLKNFLDNLQAFATALTVTAALVALVVVVRVVFR